MGSAAAVAVVWAGWVTAVFMEPVGKLWAGSGQAVGSLLSIACPRPVRRWNRQLSTLSMPVTVIWAGMPSEFYHFRLMCER